MDPFRQALYARLTGATAVTGLLASGAGGVWHRRADLGAPDPLVIFNRQSGTDGYLLGNGELLEQTWAVKAVVRQEDAKGVATAENIAAVIDATLHDAPLVIAGHTVLWIRRQSIIDYEEDDGPARFHHEGGVYRLASEPS